MDEFQGLQKQLVDFVHEWGEADLNDLKMKNPLAPIQLKLDTALLVISYHNRRHLWQAENVKKNAGFRAESLRPRNIHHEAQRTQRSS